MVRMKLEGHDPFHCLEECENAVYKYRLANSKKARAISKRIMELDSQIRVYLGNELDDLTNTLTGLTNVYYAYWWVTGLSVALGQEKTSSILNRSFALPHTKEIDIARESAAQYIRDLSKRLTLSFEEIKGVREYHAMYLEECNEIGAYAFLYGLEWGYNLLEHSGLQKYKPEWEKIYQRLPLW